MVSNKYEKCGLLSACLLLICGNICSYLSYSEVYTTDVYSRLFPIFFLFEIVIIGVLGWYIICLKRYSSIGNSPILLWVAVFIALCARLMILYLPHISGIAGYAGDHNTHAVYIYEIVSNGAFHTGNDYPFAHIVAAVTHLLSGVTIPSVIYYLIGVFLIVFVGGVYLLAKILLNSDIKEQKIKSNEKSSLSLLPLLVLLIAFIGMMVPTIHYAPHNVSNLLYPIIFGICLTYAGTHHRRYAVLAAIILIPFAFYHPAGALFLFVSYLGYLIFTSAFILIDNKSLTACWIFLRSNWVPILFFVGMIAIFLFWSISLHSRFDANIRQMFNQILGSMEISGRFDVISTKLNKAGVTNIVDIMILGLKMYGLRAVAILISLISFVILYISRKSSSLWTPALGGIFGVSGMYVFFYGISLIGIAGSESMSLARFEPLLLTFTPIFIGFLLYHFRMHRSHLFWSRSLIVIICIALSVFGVVSCFAAYPSPFIEQGTPTNSASDLSPYHWSFIYGTAEISYINPPLTAIYRIAPLAYVYYESLNTLTVTGLSDSLKSIPTLSDHFGYNESEQILSNIIGSDIFIPILEYDRIIYDKIYTKLDRLNSRDFRQLEMDWSVSKIYTNKGYSDLYLTM